MFDCFYLLQKYLISAWQYNTDNKWQSIFQVCSIFIFVQHIKRRVTRLSCCARDKLWVSICHLRIYRKCVLWLIHVVAVSLHQQQGYLFQIFRGDVSLMFYVVRINTQVTTYPCTGGWRRVLRCNWRIHLLILMPNFSLIFLEPL